MKFKEPCYCGLNYDFPHRWTKDCREMEPVPPQMTRHEYEFYKHKPKHMSNQQWEAGIPDGEI